MKQSKYVGAIMAGVIVLGLAGSVLAFGLSMSGKIVSVDPQQQRITLRTGLLFTKEFELGPHVEITDGRRSLRLGQLQRGDEATVQYVEADGKRVAQAITVKKKEGESSEVAPAPERMEPPRAQPVPEGEALPRAPASEGMGTPDTTRNMGSGY